MIEMWCLKSIIRHVCIHFKKQVQISVGPKGKVVPLKDAGVKLPLDDHDVKQVVEVFKQESIVKAALHEQSQEIPR